MFCLGMSGPSGTGKSFLTNSYIRKLSKVAEHCDTHNTQYTYLHNRQKRCVICALRSMKYVYKQLDVPSMNKKQFNSKYPKKDVQNRICSKVARITLASPCPIHILSAFL